MNSIHASQLEGLNQARVVRTTNLAPVQQPGRQNAAVSGAESPSTAATQPTEVRSTELMKAVSDINSYVQKLSRDLSFTVDEGTGRTVIKVMDGAAQEVIRQIPTEEVLAIARHLQDSDGTAVEGMLLNTRT